MTQNQPSGRSRYDAFLSYTRTPDRGIAEALQRGLHRFAKPVFARRAVWVFRDEASLPATPSLPTHLRTALEESRHLILLACPESAARPYVQFEVEQWVQRRGSAGVLLVLTAGEIVWDRERRDFDWTRTTALPAALSGVFAEEPGWIDCRAGRALPRPSLRELPIATAVAQLAAALTGRKLEELYGEDVAAQRRLARLRNAAIAGILTLAVALLIAWWVALGQRDQARARQLAAQAEVLRGEGARSTLDAAAVAMESLAWRDSFEANHTLRQALHSWYQAWESDLGGRVASLAFDPAGKRLAAGSTDGNLLAGTGLAVVIDADSGKWTSAVRPTAPSGVWSLGLGPQPADLLTRGLGVGVDLRSVRRSRAGDLERR